MGSTRPSHHVEVYVIPNFFLCTWGAVYCAFCLRVCLQPPSGLLKAIGYMPVMKLCLFLRSTASWRRVGGNGGIATRILDPGTRQRNFISGEGAPIGWEAGWAPGVFWEKEGLFFLTESQPRFLKARVTLRPPISSSWRQASWGSWS
jgi:hypothetical protein